MIKERAFGSYHLSHEIHGVSSKQEYIIKVSVTITLAGFQFDLSQ